jgi:pilus assembly protein CpaC
MAGALKSPTDRAGPPNEADLFLNGRTDTGVPPSSAPFVQPVPGPVIGSPSPGGMAQARPVGFEKDYGHVL